jgi:predicted Zn-dependent protease
VKSGRETAREVDKEYRIITEGPQFERLQRVASAVVSATRDPEIAANYLKRYKLPHPNDNARRVPFEFSFKLVRPKDGHEEINAFSLAGGPVFVTTDLMDVARSDHELAAVLGHECGHICYHHVVQLVNKQAKAQRGMLWTTLGSLLLGAAGAGGEALSALYGAQLYSIATLTGYGRELEREADRVGIDLVMKTDYSAVGMLTFMKKLARDEARRGDDLGIYQSHPYSSERTVLIEQRLKQLHVACDAASQRRVANAFLVEVQAQVAEGRELGEIRLNGKPVIQLADPERFSSALERAQAVGHELEGLFLQQSLTIRDLRLGTDRTTILARGHQLLRVLPEDAQAARRPAADVADSALKVLQAELWREKLDQTF